MKTHSFGPFRLLADGTLLRKRRALELPPKQKALLLLLASSGGRLVSKRELLDRLWPGVDVSEASLTSCIHGLRLALDDRRRRGRYLETVHGRGYRFHATVSVAAAAAAERGPRGVSPVRVAVAPFAGRGATPRYLAEGLSAEVSAGLAHWREDGIDAIAPGSAARGWQSGGPKSVLGGGLDVGFVVTGRVRSGAREVRAAVALIRAGMREPVWSDEFAGPPRSTGLLATQIAEAIAKRLLEGRGSSFSPHALPLLSSDPRAYRALLRGLFLNQFRDESGLRRSIACFEQALDWDPDCSAAHVALAEAHLNLGWRGFAPPREVAPLAREALARALEIDPHAELAHAGRAFLAMLVDRDVRTADEALALAAEDGGAHDRSAWMRGNVLIAANRCDEALDALDAACALDPLSPNLAILRAFALWFGGRLEEALSTARELTRREPEFPAAQGLHANVAILRGLRDEALRAAERADVLARGDQMTRSCVVWTLAQAGRSDAARAIQGVLERRAKSRYVSPTFLAVGYAGLGDRERALHWLERAGAARCMWLAFASADPRLASLRDDPRFEAILSEAGLGALRGRHPGRVAAGATRSRPLRGPDSARRPLRIHSGQM